MGGRQLASGDALFTQHQPIDDPRLRWVGSSLRRQQRTYWTASPLYPNAGAVPRRLLQSLPSNGVVLSEGRVLSQASGVTVCASSRPDPAGEP